VAPRRTGRACAARSARADTALETSGLDWTIVRPGRLTDEPGTGTVELASALGRRGEIPRDDVALVLYHCLTAENTVRAQFDLLSGPVPADIAVRSVQPGSGPVNAR
jgi:hypothetical protein